MTPKLLKIGLMLCLWQMCVAGLFSQTTLTGKVLDQQTKAPIPYASVFVENTFTGIATGDDGSFSLEVKEGHQGQVIVRAMGYDTKSIPQSDFALPDLDIYLLPASFAIQEVEASAKKALTDPDQIIRKAIKRIPENMASDYTVLEGTYHQAFQDYETDKLLDASQVKVKVGLQGIKMKHKTDSIWHDEPLSDNVFWENFRYNDDALLPQYQIPDYGTDHLQCLLRMDPVRNYRTPTFDFVGRLDKDFIDNHYFWLDSIGVYNGQNVYCITLYLLNEIRFSQINLLSGIYEPMPIRNSRDDTKPIQLGFMYLKRLDGERAAIPIGKLKVTTSDFAITYFEYTNGFGNDRYKFIAEYAKVNGRYYASKLYFANKFRMNNSPDFNAQGDIASLGVKSLMGEKYYHSCVEKYSKSDSNAVVVNQIIKENTIPCPTVSIIKDDKIRYIKQIVAQTKIVEDIQEIFTYKAYGKLLHHRLIDFALPLEEGCRELKSDFHACYYPLGDRKFHWNYYPYKGAAILTIKSKAISPFSVHFNAPLPITSTDENRYVKIMYRGLYPANKAHLVKGSVPIQ